MKNAISLTRRQTLALVGASVFAPRAAFAAPRAPVLVELFTSQGCSSCPPADEYASELVKDPNTVVVSFNVDYWDYLGWRDTLAKPEYSKRQYDYAKVLDEGSVYTPQMVVNGATHAVGSSRRDVAKQISASREIQAAASLKVSLTAEKISVEIKQAEFKGDATLWLMAVEPRSHSKNRTR